MTAMRGPLALQRQFAVREGPYARGGAQFPERPKWLMAGDLRLLLCGDSRGRGRALPPCPPPLQVTVARKFQKGKVGGKSVDPRQKKEKRAEKARTKRDKAKGGGKGGGGGKGKGKR